MDQSAAVDVTDAVRRIEAAAASIPVHVARRPGPAAAEVLARAYEKATAGTSTWYRTGKRALHQPQLERFVGELTHYLDNVTAIVELGAGKGLLGRVLQDVSAISRGDRGALPLVAIEQRECPTYDSREHDVTRLNGTSVAQGFVLDDKIPHGALVIAKHFCGNASDEAVRLILASERVALAALAPCCHPAMQWGAFCAREAKGPLGALLTEAHFPILLDLIALSRHGRGGSSGRDCKRWESLQALGADYVNGKVPRIIAEVALRELIVPVVMQPDELRKKLLQPRPSRKRKAAAGGEASASAATDADGPADVSHLLIESCAAKRTELVARMQHLFVALAELRKL